METNKNKIAVIIIVIVALLLIALRAYKKRKEMIRECKFFKSSEFDSPDVPGSGKNMQHSTLLMLCHARKISGVPFVINSGFRTIEHNKAIGGVADSAHLKGYASDIATPNGKNQILILRALRLAGFKRFGVYNNFIHVDNDPRKKQFVAWGAKSKDVNPFNFA